MLLFQQAKFNRDCRVFDTINHSGNMFDQTLIRSLPFMFNDTSPNHNPLFEISPRESNSLHKAHVTQVESVTLVSPLVVLSSEVTLHVLCAVVPCPAATPPAWKCVWRQNESFLGCAESASQKNQTTNQITAA